MKKFFKKQRELIAVALFFLAVGAMGYFVVAPLLKKIASIKNEIDENKIKQEIKKQRLEELPKIAQQYTSISSQQKKFDILLDKQQAVALIERLEGLAQDTNNKIQIVVQEDASAKKTADSKSKTAPKVPALIDTLPRKEYLKLRITLTGDYDGVFKFVHRLESLEYYADIIEINIGQVASNQTTSVASLGMDGSNPFNDQVAKEPALGLGDPNQLATALIVVFYSKN
jgi:hypothetical protein